VDQIPDEEVMAAWAALGVDVDASPDAPIDNNESTLTSDASGHQKQWR
jgi:hypothetical protein